MTEKEKMIQGLPYNPAHPRLILDRDRAGRICTCYNQKVFHEIDMRNRLMRNLLHARGSFWIKPPFFCDYGYNIYLGKGVMLNYGCVLLDVCRIRIGDHTLIGPNTQIYTACHATDPKLRLKGAEFGRPVRIGANVWIGGGCIILPGVTIGNNAVIGAGSVVTKPVPANTVAFGNPCRVVRRLDREDRLSRTQEVGNEPE